MTAVFKKLVCIYLFFIPFCLSAQTLSKQNWSINSPFEEKVFIENNEGQFDGKLTDNSSKILFSTSVDGLTLFFTASGVSYRYDKALNLDKEQREKMEKEGKKFETSKPVSNFFSCLWAGANPDVNVTAEDEASFYYTYPVSAEHTIIARAFKKLLYKNIYPSIDVEYFFPEDRKGIEYALIVHPGAEMSTVKLIYENAKSVSQDVKGNILIQSYFGEFIDHAPSKTYYKDSPESINTSFILKGQEVSFNIENYDRTKTLIIDPWTTNPAITNTNSAFSLRYDLQGNVYVYGGGNSTYNAPFQLVKINQFGVVQWHLNTPSGQFDDFTIDKNTGTLYVGTSPNGLWKVNSSGSVISFASTNSSQMGEIWRMNYDNCNNEIILAGGTPNGTCQATITTTTFNPITSVNVLSTSEQNHDMAMLATDEENGYCYMATMHSLLGYSDFNNVLLKCPVSTLIPSAFIVQDGFLLDEWHSMAYMDYEGNGYNGMAISPNWLYMYDGSTLKRFDKNTGNAVATLNISTPDYASSNYIHTYWGGLDVDFCDNVYLGHGTEIDIYDASFNHTGTISMASNTDTIYDVRLGPNNMLYACGKGFVAEYTVPNPALSFTKKSSPACSGCTGTALVYSSGCNTNNLSYSWSNGNTDQYITGLCPGTYSVTVSYGCEPLFSDTVQVKNSTSPSVSVPSTNITNVSCFNGNNGSAIANASFGTPQYTYQWFPVGQTGQKDSNMIAGTYTVIVKDSNGCEAVNTAIVYQPSQLNVSTTPEISIEAGQNTTLVANASGGTPQYTYQWVGGNNGPSTVVAPTVTTTYTVIVADSNGCTATNLVTVDVLCGELFVPNAFSPNGDGQNDRLYVRDNCIQSMDFIIFDRWGNKVFETENINNGWDGNGNGKPMNTGTYVWYLKATMYDGSTVERKGNASLIR